MISPNKGIVEMRSYQSPAIIESEVKLNQNESPYNLPSEIVQKFNERMTKIKFNRYPDGSSTQLKKTIAKKFSVSPDQVMVGAGIDELLYYLMIAFLNNGDKVVRPVPSFAMYEICSKIFNAIDKPVMLSEDFELTEEFVTESKNAKIVFICRPNNPTSNSFNKKTIERVIKTTTGLVCIDEAYVEFTSDDCLDFLKYENVIIMRTFSKAYSCAGVRLGYAISNQAIIECMNKVKLPWNLSAMQQVLGELIIENDRVFSLMVAEIKSAKNDLLKEMEQIVPVLPSDSNFIVFKVENPLEVFNKLLAKGVLVRNISQYPKLDKYLRVSVGTKEENQRFVTALRECILPKQDGIIFDVDGVLVDVTQSYREAIKQTVKAIGGIEVSNKDIEKIKQKPNSNNDWDVCYALVYGIDNLKSVDRSSKSYLELKEKFQEIYLGNLRGFETSLIDVTLLQKLVSDGYKLGIVTSRPRAEALYVLDRLMPGIFDPNCIIALEDCSKEKPNPKPLLLAKKRICCPNAFYVGDTINDALAAKAAGMKFVSVTAGLQGDFNISNINEIKKVLI
ncbi:MAG: histidinol-phosphate transaminase [Candidatus Micrarchaeota archaeon]